MTQHLRLIMAAAATALALLTASDPVLARGAAANIMNSPGYQRRLQESRQQLAVPEPQAPVPVKPRAKHRHRHVH
ncbi:hypothetical protein S58_45710 [Bradyrhizobium oligotrophicum S58]|uniref:Uncharacterized protein n=1 Tax=Bradyrhizobium oligotrophicum S58 TaxID=1245469 RepID=M4ZW43_9BRAD|nr:hypothetical protein [Bradyrhizobium oligotrophicum]BAM90555.1 hypothetical protein S58_45710 [Bradyrhizobium oligotrophicum S58]